MSTAITYLLTGFCIAATVFTLAGDMLMSFDDVTDAWTESEARSEKKTGTRIAGPIGLSVSATSTVQITLENEGEDALGQFSDWDVIFEVQEAPGLAITYLTYTENAVPAANQWTVKGIYLDASAVPPVEETVDPGVFNPGEEMVILAKPSPPVTANTYDRAAFVTPYGVVAKVIFHVVP